MKKDIKISPQDGTLLKLGNCALLVELAEELALREPDPEAVLVPVTGPDEVVDVLLIVGNVDGGIKEAEDHTGSPKCRRKMKQERGNCNRICNWQVNKDAFTAVACLRGKVMDNMPKQSA